jgi:beta-glucosidase
MNNTQQKNNMQTWGAMAVFLLAAGNPAGASAGESAALTAAEWKTLSAGEIAEKLVSRLTLEEKVSLCHGNNTWTVKAIPRIGLTEDITLSDGPNGVRKELRHDGYASANRTDDASTALPRSIVLAAAWDRELAAKYGDVMGAEARERNKDILLGPGINMMRSPLTGRNFEYYGEDPFLVAALGVPVVRAMQVHDIAACAKVLTPNNQPQKCGPEETLADERVLREIYLPPIEAAVKEGGALAIMTAYDKFRGEPCSQSAHLLNQILKKEWGFRGVALSDWGGTQDTVAAALGGLDLEMGPTVKIKYFKQPLLDAVKSGQVPEAVVTDKARRMLYVMACIKKYGNGPRAAGSRNTPEHQAVARQAAEEGIVLLKNGAGVLPFNPAEIKNVLVLGENAIWPFCDGGGSSQVKPPYEIMPLEGIRRYFGDKARVAWAPLRLTNRFTDIPDEVLAEGPWKAEYFGNIILGGKPVPAKEWRPRINAKDSPLRKDIPEANFSVRWTAKIKAPETGAFVFAADHTGGLRMLLDGKSVIDDWQGGAQRTATAAVELEKGREYILVVESFQQTKNPFVRVRWQEPSLAPLSKDALLARVKAADAVILVAGNRINNGGRAPRLEDEQRGVESEAMNRPDMRLPEGQDEAISTVLAANTKAVVVNLSGAPVAMPWVKEAATILHAGFGGMEAGSALARVLFGDVNPSGKLPYTFPVRREDCPPQLVGDYTLFSEQGDVLVKRSAKTSEGKVDYTEGLFVGYRWFDEKKIEPLFPFGHGLSYTTFEIGAPELSARQIKPGGDLTVKVKVTNTGKRAGAEVVQLYVADPEASVPRPPKELKGFAKVFLQPGETRGVEMKLTTRDLSFWDTTANAWKAEPGTFRVLTGNSSRGKFQEAAFELKAPPAR